MWMFVLGTNCCCQVSTTTPPSNEPEPTPMADLDPAAVESMIADNGLNEVTLKVWRAACACMHVLRKCVQLKM